MSHEVRDHGGGLDGAADRYGGARSDWLDLSTGINPEPYPVGVLDGADWTALPDKAASDQLIRAARRFWQVPQSAAILAAPGASSLISRLPFVWPQGRVDIPAPTYNEHAAAFAACGWELGKTGAARVLVHPNNPDGRLWGTDDLAGITIIDESFCDVCPDRSLIAQAERPDTIVLKSFGKFWGLAGLRLGFAIGEPDLIARLSETIGPWAVSGPALRIGARALQDDNWAAQTRLRLEADAARLDELMARAGARCIGGTSLFRLYDTEDASAWQDRLARAQIWSRIFPYSARWLRLGLPAQDGWNRLEAALT